jgi:hypothetical protein
MTASRSCVGEDGIDRALMPVALAPCRTAPASSDHRLAGDREARFRPVPCPRRPLNQLLALFDSFSHALHSAPILRIMPCSMKAGVWSKYQRSAAVGKAENAAAPVIIAGVGRPSSLGPRVLLT